jgi:hypothetical protein
MNILDAQRALFRLGFDPQGCDGVMGPHTQAALRAFQATQTGDTWPYNVTVTGALDEPTELALDNALMSLEPFIAAAHYSPANRPYSAPLDLIVIHTMEAPKSPNRAVNVAQWFAGDSAPQASAHYCIDDQDTVCCVVESDVAWGAPGANNQGIHLEHAGYASQSPADWQDDYAQAMLDRSARLAARLVRRWSIPIQHLSVAELAAGGRGFCGHVDVTNAFDHGRGHTDPGPNFPWEGYLLLVRSYV